MAKVRHELTDRHRKISVKYDFKKSNADPDIVVIQPTTTTKGFHDKQCQRLRSSTNIREHFPSSAARKMSLVTLTKAISVECSFRKSD